MIIEDTIENAVVALLQATTTGLNIVRGMEDVAPNLSLPALVVTCDEQERISARREIYKVRVLIEYKSIPEEHTVAGGTGVESEMGQVDAALTTQPSGGVLAGLPLGTAQLIAWHSLNRTQQDVHTDRRTNTREILLVLAFS